MLNYIERVPVFKTEMSFKDNLFLALVAIWFSREEWHVTFW